MSQRRMFSPDIVESDAFIEMPASSQSLYFHLGMYADDDGFVNPKRIMRMLGAAEDDLKVLLSKRFLLTFENGVVVIKHWRINNLVRKDWYKETQYTEQKALLKVKENGAYTELVNENVPNSLTQVRLGKVRLGKVKENKVAVAPSSPLFSDTNFNQLWNDYLVMRAKIKKPATEKAKQLALKELEKYDVATACKMLEQSVLNSWQGIFPLKNQLATSTDPIEQFGRQLAKEMNQQYGEKGDNIALFRFRKKYGDEVLTKYMYLFPNF